MIGYEGYSWVCYFWFVGWECISFGIHFDISRRPHIELHIPFGWIRIGRQRNHEPIYNQAGWHLHKNRNFNKPQRWRA